MREPILVFSTFLGIVNSAQLLNDTSICGNKTVFIQEGEWLSNPSWPKADSTGGPDKYCSYRLGEPGLNKNIEITFHRRFHIQQRDRAPELRIKSPERNQTGVYDFTYFYATEKCDIGNSHRGAVDPEIEGWSWDNESGANQLYGDSYQSGIPITCGQRLITSAPPRIFRSSYVDIEWSSQYGFHLEGFKLKWRYVDENLNEAGHIYKNEVPGEISLNNYQNGWEVEWELGGAQ